MRRDRYPVLKVLALALWIFPAHITAQEEKAKSPAQRRQVGAPATDANLAKLNAEVIRTMTAYQKSLEKMRAIHEEEFRKRVKEVQERRELYEKGYLSVLDLDESQRNLAKVERELLETEVKILETKIAIREASALRGLLRLPPLAPGGYSETSALIRYNGAASWSLTDAKKIEKFFKDVFGRPLPVSAMGQTPFHERMRLDHRNAMDVAVHPDSSEGRALMDYLRKEGIPFVAFRNSVPGSASGAHIHVGNPSFRVVSNPSKPSAGKASQ